MQVYCLKCGHSLRHQTSNTCPACGKVFDINDSSTFRRRKRRRIPIISILIIALGTWFFVYGSYRFLLELLWHPMRYAGAGVPPEDQGQVEFDHMFSLFIWLVVAIFSLLVALIVNHSMKETGQKGGPSASD